MIDNHIAKPKTKEEESREYRVELNRRWRDLQWDIENLRDEYFEESDRVKKQGILEKIRDKQDECDEIEGEML